jgi:acyl carrier protein
MKEKKLFQIVADQLDIPIENIALNSSFADDLGADSLDQVEMIMAVEEKWGIIINDNDAEKFETVKDVLDYLKKLSGEQK